MDVSLNAPIRYSRVITFLIDFTGQKGEAHIIWRPENAVFELAALTIRSNVAADLNVCDSDPAIPIGFISLDGLTYEPMNMGSGSIRSFNTTTPRLILMDPVGVVMAVKGVAYGYEVTPEGIYR